jgi:hypothetical protein
MKALVLSTREWEENIKPALIKEYGKSIAISWVCKRELGFTVRYHRAADRMDAAFGKEEVHLDFYDEASQTMFLLKFK